MISKYIIPKASIYLLLLLIHGLCFSQEYYSDSDSLIVIKEKQERIDIGLGTQPEWMITSAVSHVEGSVLEKFFSSNLGNTLKANLSGLTVSGGGGEPGLQSSSFWIRGLNTFGNGRNVLVIVDGLEFPAEQLDPKEIKSVAVLKDAAATAIYGSKGANGVLLVTTKRGIPGALTINLNMQHGYSAPLNMPRFLNSHDYARLYNEALVNDGKPEMYSHQQLEAYQKGSNPYLFPDVDWYDKLLRKMVPVSKIDLNFTGGNQIARYFVFLGLMSEDGLYKKTENLSTFSINSKYQRFNYRSNIDISLTNRLSAHLTLGGIVEDKSNPANSRTSEIFNTMSLLPPNAFPVYNPNGTYGGSNLYSNPWGDILEKGMYTTNGRVFQGSFMLTEQLDMITKGLSLSGQVAFNSTFNDLSNKWRNYQSYAYSENEEGNPVYTQIGENTSLAASEGQSNQWRSTALRVYLNYSRSFSKIDLDGILLFNSSNYTLGVGGLPYYDKGIFGRFTYAWEKKYIGELSFGYNATDNFPKDGRWGLFPAVSLGWVVSNEDFLKGSGIIDFFKIKGSYGLTGNDNIGGERFMFRDIWGGVGRYYFGAANTNVGSLGITTYANPDVTWEKQKQLNVGIETTLWENVGFYFDAFYQKRHDILTKPYNVLPGFLGMTYPELNVGRTENKGFESTIRYCSNNEGHFNYYVQLMVWYAKNKIIDNAEGLQQNEYLYRSGNPVNQPFVLEAIGFFSDQADIDNSPKQVFSEVRPGDIKYKDQNNDNVIDNLDFYPMGFTSLPELTSGISAGINYGNIDFNFVLQGATNNTIYLSGPYFEAFQNNGKISEVALGRWTEETKDIATYPRLASENNINNYQPSSFWQRDGSFLNLRNIEFGYTLPKSITGSTGLKKMRFFLNGSNLYTLDRLTSAERGSSVSYPFMRTFSVGLNLQF